MTRRLEMNKAIVALIGFLLFVACTAEKADEDVSAVAKSYYDELLNGHADRFVSHTYMPEAIPEGYRQQLESNARMWVAEMNSEHGGVYSVRAVNHVYTDAEKPKSGKQTALPFAANSKEHSEANAFLVLCFADSLNEQIVVPMVKRNGEWLMR